MDRDPFNDSSRFRIPDLSEFRLLPVSLKKVWRGMTIIVLLFLAWGSFYQIEPEEVDVVLRLGRHVRTTEPGLRGKMPLVEGVIKVPVQRQLKQELGFRATESNVRNQFTEASFLEESMMLTGDLNVATVEWIVQYRVSDPYNFLFKVRNLESTFRSLNEAVMREVVGDRTVT